MDRLEEFKVKVERVRQLCEREELEGLLLGSAASFAWITCGGDNRRGLAEQGSPASVLITFEDAWLICEEGERSRLAEEEIAGLPLEIQGYSWYEGSEREAVEDILEGARWGADVPGLGVEDFSEALSELRRALLPPEVERLQWVGREAEAALRAVCFELEPGETEYELAGRLAAACYDRKLYPAAVLAAVDDRMERAPRPVPTDKELTEMALLTLGARRWGLHVYLTRMVRFGMIDSELRTLHDGVTSIAASMMLSSRVGVPGREVFERAREAYRKAGHPDNWQEASLGGGAGYDPGRFAASPECDLPIAPLQALSWSPWIGGCRSQDTLVVSESEITIVTEARHWPRVEQRISGILVPRPDILVR
jgi:Xaa-Pro aminopeptidase